MPFITSPAIFTVRNGAGDIVSNNATTLTFAGEVSVIETSPGQVRINVGGPGSGEGNTVAYFGPDGDLKSDDSFSYTELQKALYFGVGFFNIGSNSFGFGDASNGVITMTNESLAFGAALSASSLSANHRSSAFGLSNVQAELGANNSSLAFGQCLNASFLRAGFNVINVRSCLVFGSSTDASYLGTKNNGSGCLIFGNSSGGSELYTLNAVGCFVGGSASNSGQIICSGTVTGIFAFAANGGIAQNTGSYSFLGGLANGGLNLTNSGQGAFIFGIGHSNTGNGAFVVGEGHVNTENYCAIIGSYARLAGDLVAPNPAFLIGRGTGPSGRDNAFEVYKSGFMRTFGGQMHITAKITTPGPYNVNPLTDRSLFVDSSVGPIQLNLPSGEVYPGFELFIKDVGNNASVNNITLVQVVGEGLETGASITVNAGALHIVYNGGAWWIMSKYIP